MTLSAFLSMIGLTLRDPRAVARYIVALDWPSRARWDALFLVCVLSAMGGEVLQILSGEVVFVSVLGIQMSVALGLGLVQLVVMIIGAYAAAGLGRMAGGSGDLGGALLLLAWLQAVLLVFQLVQIALIVVFPGLSGALGLLAFILSFWLMTVFIAELHGFRSLGLVLLSIVGTMIVIGLIMSFVIGLMGFQILLGTT